MSLQALQRELRSKANPRKAELLARFFKTGNGDYGEGDRFLGLMVPEIRRILIRYYNLSLREIEKLLQSKFHEERLAALLLLVHQFQKGDSATQTSIYQFYMRNAKCVNNWDLVDLSAGKLVGAYLYDKSRAPLYSFTKSRNLWERRIAIVATSYFIGRNEFSDTLNISALLLRDHHDLIHKAVGWMLREVGKRDQAVEEQFLKKYYRNMPRVMLRYAIERFSQSKQRFYLS